MNKMSLMVLLVFAILVAGCTQPAAPPPSNTTVSAHGASVMITSFSFEPPSITVPKGTTVTWTNQDPVAHTVTGADFDSGPIDPGKTFSHAFNQAGSYEYHCSIHTSMKGTVIVQ
jgi:plastocyanin